MVRIFETLPAVETCMKFVLFLLEQTLVDHEPRLIDLLQILSLLPAERAAFLSSIARLGPI